MNVLVGEFIIGRVIKAMNECTCRRVHHWSCDQGYE